MRCPNCGGILRENSIERCANCGVLFDEDTKRKLLFYFEIKKGVLSTKEALKKYQNKMALLDNKLVSLGYLLNKDLRFIKEETLLLKNSESESEKLVSEKEVLSDKKTADLKMKKSVGKDGVGSNWSGYNWSGYKWFLVIGILAMVFGIGYFLKYSFENMLFNPVVKFISVLLWGGIFVFAGQKMKEKGYKFFGSGIAGAGVAMLYFGIFAGYQIYNFYSKPIAYLFMCLITMGSISFSIFIDSVFFASIGTLGGFLTPVLLGLESEYSAFFLTYILILNIGIMVISFFKRLGVLRYIGLASTYFLFTLWMILYYKNSFFWQSIIYLNLYNLIYAVSPLAQLLKQKDNKVSIYNFYVFNSFIAFILSAVMIKSMYSFKYVSFISVYYSLLYLVVSCFVYLKLPASKKALSIFLGKSLFYLVLAVPIYFSSKWVSVYWLLISVFVYYFGRKWDINSWKKWGEFLAIVGSLKILLFDLSVAYGFSFISMVFKNGYFFEIVQRMVVYLVGFGSLVFFTKMSEKNKGAFSFLLCFFTFYLANIETFGYFYEYFKDIAYAAISVLWGAFSIGILAIAIKKQRRSYRRFSAVISVMLILKLFFNDMFGISDVARIISFIAAGLFLIIFSFYYYRAMGVENTNKMVS